MQELFFFLIKQSYHEAIIECGLERAMSLDKETLRTVKAREEEPYNSIRIQT